MHVFIINENNSKKKIKKQIFDGDNNFFSIIQHVAGVLLTHDRKRKYDLNGLNIEHLINFLSPKSQEENNE